MKSNWKTVTLESICRQITDGSHFSPKTADSGFPYITVRDIENDQIDFDNCKFVSADDFNQLLKNGCKPNKGDVLFSKDGTVGKVALVDYETNFVVLSSLAILRPDNNQIDSAFLKYVLKSPAFLDEAIGKKTGVAIRRIILRNLKAILVPVPPLPEQQRIVGILDAAFDGIATAKATAEQNLQNARALFESHLQSVFTQRGEGWVEKPLNAVCDLQNGYAFKSGDYIESSNTLNIRMSSIRPGGSFDSEHNQRFLPDSYAKEYASFLLKEGDLIIAMTDMAGDPKILGVPTLVSNLNGRNFLMNQRVGKLFGFSESVRVPYLRYFLASPLIKQYYKSKGAGGLQINISKGDILSAQIPIPGIVVQDRVVNQLDELVAETQRLESLYQRKLAALDELKKSLLHQAFSGAL